MTESPSRSGAPVDGASGDSGVDPGHYRELMSTFPSGVAVVTAIDSSGTPRGATCSSLSSVTVSPPTLLVCLHEASGTLAATRESGVFAVNLLHARGEETAVVFSSAVADRFDRVPWQRLEESGPPHLSRDAFAVATCRVVDQVVVGDHAVVLGEVSDIRLSRDVPLLYGLRRFSAWPATATER